MQRKSLEAEGIAAAVGRMMGGIAGQMPAANGNGGQKPNKATGQAKINPLSFGTEIK